MTGTIERPDIAAARDAVNDAYMRAMSQVGAIRQKVTATGTTVATTIEHGEQSPGRHTALAQEVRELTAKQLTAVAAARETVLPTLSDTASRLTFAMNFPGSDPHPPIPQPVTPAQRIFYVHEPPVPPTARYADASSRPIVRLGAVSSPPEQQGAPTCTINAVMSGVQDLRPRRYDRMVRRDAHAGVVSARVHHGEHLMYDTLPVSAASGALIYTTSNDGTVGSSFLEKAWAGRNTYGGSEPAAVMTWMIGSGTTDPTPGLSNDDLGDLALSRDKLAIMGLPETKHPRTNELLTEHNIFARHSYYLADMTPDGKYVLHNPWNVEHPTSLDEATLRELFREITWGDLHELDALTRG